MKTIGQLTVSTPSDREIRMTRLFDAPSQLVYDAIEQVLAGSAGGKL